MGPPKSGEARTLPVHPELRRALDRAREDQREALGRDLGPTDLVCVTGVWPRSTLSRVHGEPRPWARSSALAVFRRDMERAGLSMTGTGQRSLHTCRHSFVSGLLAGGADERTTRSFTHAPTTADAFSAYVHGTWERACAAIRLLSYGRP
jgi:integrase